MSAGYGGGGSGGATAGEITLDATTYTTAAPPSTTTPSTGYKIDLSGGDVPIPIPAASAGNAGRVIELHQVAAGLNGMLITPTSGTIEGASSLLVQGVNVAPLLSLGLRSLGASGGWKLITTPPTKTAVAGASQAHEYEEMPAIVTSSTASPFTLFSFPLATGSAWMIKVRAICRNADFSRRAEWRARQMFGRSTGGASSRDGTPNGVQDSVANTFTGPSNSKPSLSFGDPSATHIATVLGQGRPPGDGTLTWSFWVQIVEVH